MMKTLLVWIIPFLIVESAQAQKPTITSFAPTSGPIGTAVTIVGTNFSTTTSNNIVYFGATRATVTSATATQLTATVPAGATYQPITVLVNGLLAYSSMPFVVTFSGGLGITTGTFASKTDFTTGTNPGSSSIGDLDGDGKADLAVANASSNTVSIFRNTSTGSGSISYAAKVDFTTGSLPYFVSIGDLDGDGKADLAVANFFSDDVSIFRNTSTTGSISYAAKVDFTTGDSPLSVSIGDLDGDGKADLAVANYSSSTVSIFRNTSTGSGSISYAAKVDFTTGSFPYSVSIGDLDGDGKADLAIGKS
jgi:FG-GAP-like repeat/IPT/TIG domain